MSTQGRNAWKRARSKLTYAWEPPKLTHVTAETAEQVVLDSDGLYKRSHLVDGREAVEEELLRDFVEYGTVQQILMSMNPVFLRMKERREQITEALGPEIMEQVHRQERSAKIQLDIATDDFTDETIPWPPFTPALWKRRKKVLELSALELDQATREAIAEYPRSRLPSKKEDFDSPSPELVNPDVVSTEILGEIKMEEEPSLLDSLLSVMGVSESDWAMAFEIEKHMREMPLPSYLPDYLAPYEPAPSVESRSRCLPDPVLPPHIETLMDQNNWKEAARQFLLAAQAQLDSVAEQHEGQ
eukprot:Blabericola_migrator_1__1040@NODE_1264_length_4945_cov_61_847683_g854_i0_p3_GENE_NODE_1264_length_4945_cov_61_847683_g854_i0NODE_1264_length_4945_cov_61_847683_g854_i0_p3_ORF_typecomplete_len300_score68_83_NODE_1264_length_4945_cov_61_847683_g854_i02381137